PHRTDRPRDLLAQDRPALRVRPQRIRQPHAGLPLSRRRSTLPSFRLAGGSNPMRRLAVLASMLWAASALADPYTLSRGATTLTLVGSVWRIHSFFNGDGDRKVLPFTITQTDVTLGLEHGLTDRLTLSA